MMKDFYKLVVETSPNGYAFHKIICNDEGEPCDYEFIEVNTAFENLTGLKATDIIGKRALEILPGLRDGEFDWVKVYGSIAMGGTPMEFEQYSLPLNKWYRVNVHSTEKYFFITHFVDITNEKCQLSALKSMVSLSEEFLHISDQEIDYQKITDVLLRITGARYAVFNLFDEDGKNFISKAVSGDNEVIEKITTILGYEIEGKIWNQDQVPAEKIKNTAITRFSSLTELVGDVLAKPLVMLIEKTFNIGEVVLIKILRNDIMLGDFTLFMVKGELFNQDTLAELFTKQIGSAIIHKRTEKVLLQEKMCLADSEKKYRQISENISDVVWTTDLNLKITYISPSIERVMGYPIQTYLDRKLEESFTPESLKRINSALLEELANEKDPTCDKDRTLLIEVEQYRADRVILWVAMNISFLRDYNGNAIGLQGVSRDISGRKLAERALQESENRLIAAQKMAHVGSWELIIDEKKIWATEESYNIYGIEYTSQFLPLDTIQALAMPEYRKLLDDKLIDLITKQKKYDVEFKIKKANTGEELFVRSKAMLQFDNTGKAYKIVGTIQDITDRKNVEEELLFLSYRDYLTGLYNRRYLEEEKYNQDIESQLPLSIIIGDINGLKLINDAFGHAEGDKLLIKTARIMQICCRKEDIVARTGGDEFSILLPRTDSIRAYEILKKIQTVCETHNQTIANDIYHINISLGFGTKETIDEDFQEIIKTAEDYMYHRKLLEHKSSHSAIISSIKATMHEKNHDTEAHAERLVALSKMVGEAINLSQIDIDKLVLLAMLHDIGKVGIDDLILNKAGKLSEEEWVEMRKHPMIGYRIAKSSPDLVLIAEYILSHHERWDGWGYPQGLVGKDIPLLSRILAVIDAYDAMTQDRSYRNAMTKKDAIREIKENAGTQFDPEIALIFTRLLEERNL